MESLKVTYSKKYINPIFLLFSFCFLGVLLMLLTWNIYVYIASIVFITLDTVFCIYLALNRISEITLKDGKLYIGRFLPKSLICDVKNIRYLSIDVLVIGKRQFNLRYVLNKRELVTLLLNGMETRNMDEALSAIFSGKRLYGSLEQIEKTLKDTKASLKFTLIFVGIVFITTAVLSHLGMIFIICFFICAGFGYLKAIIFDKKLRKIHSKSLRTASNILIYLLYIVLTVILGIAVHKAFMLCNIDLLKPIV